MGPTGLKQSLASLPRWTAQELAHNPGEANQDHLDSACAMLDSIKQDYNSRSCGQASWDHQGGDHLEPKHNVRRHNWEMDKEKEILVCIFLVMN